MKKFFEWCKYYLLPILFVVGVIIVCILFLLDNLPHDDSDLTVDFSTEKIVINNDLLLTDAVGKNITAETTKVGTTGYAEFEVKSNVDSKIKYEIYLKKEDASPEIPVDFVKVYLTDENDKPLTELVNGACPTYFDLKVADNDLGGKLLYSGSFNNKESKKFKLRMWVADTYELKAETNIFSVKINVKVK